MAREAREYGLQRVSLMRPRLLLRVQAQLNIDGHTWRGNPPVDRPGGDVRQAHPRDGDLLVLLWYESDEIEAIAEDELRRADLMPWPDDPVTDLERLIEGHLKAQLDQYAQLPEGVLGLTRFGARRPVVSISSALTEAAEEDPPLPGKVGRWRATLAHEASHIFLHRYLFDADMAPLSNRPPDQAPAGGSTVMRCLHRDVNDVRTQDWGRTSRRQDWCEVQANRGMAALLMPSRTFKDVAFDQIAKLGLSDLHSSPDSAETLATAITGIFQVSKQTALIRLGTLQVVRAE